MRHLFYWFAMITGIPVFGPIFRTKVYYEDRSVQGRFIPRRTIVVSNHLQLFDYVVFLLATVPRFSHALVAEIMYQKNFMLTFLLKALGSIRVDREEHSTRATEEAVRQLRKGRTIYINPEGRLPLKDEKRPIEFHTGFVHMALESGAKVIPVYTNGENFTKKRARFIIGKPIDIRELYDDSKNLHENAREIADKVSEKIVRLGVELERQRG